MLFDVIIIILKDFILTGNNDLEVAKLNICETKSSCCTVTTSVTSNDSLAFSNTICTMLSRGWLMALQIKNKNRCLLAHTGTDKTIINY